MKKIFYILIAILFLQTSVCDAQSWQWAKRGGGKTGSGSNEELKSIAIDKNGNSYILASVNSDKISGDIDIDGNKLGKGNDGEDLCLASFDCSGKFRWSKVIGGRYSDITCDVKVDTLGGIYIAGNFFAGNMFDSISVATDTTILSPTTTPYKFYQSLFVIKYDSNGNFRWLRMAEPDTMTSTKYSRAVSMDVDKSGNISVLTCINSTGAFSKGSYIIPPSTILPSMHMLKYDANGNFIKGFPMDISEGGLSSLFFIRMVWDWKSNVYYLLTLNTGSGYIAPKFGTTKMTGTNCLAKYSNTGVNLWVKQSSSTYSAGYSSNPVIDADGNIYIGSSEKIGDNFAGYTVTNALTGALSLPVILKLKSSDGSLIWGKTISADYSAGGFAVGVSPNGTVALATVSLRTISIGSFKSYSAGTAMNAALIGFDQKTGSLMFFDTLNSTNAFNSANVLTTDTKGNYYFGGTFDASISIQGLGLLTKYGGRDDFFFAKYGVADCIPTTAINETATSQSAIKIYPNPATDLLTIDGAAKGTEVALFNIIGQSVYTGKIENTQQQISLSGLANGMYLLQLKTANGEVYNAKIIKE